MANINNEQINLELRDHQKGLDGWKEKYLAENLHQWAERFALEFKLKTSVPALMLDRLGRTRCGHFRRGRNGFGLLNEIAINERYISQERYWDALATLLHELLHAEQETVGNPGKGNYHNKEFRYKAETLGLIVDSWGHMFLAPSPSPFWTVLQKYGIEVPEIPKPVPVVAGQGNSKLKLWVCSCEPQPIRVRVAISDFRAICLKCRQLFVKQS